MNYASIIIPFVGGLGMFIYGMQIMAQGLENAAGSRMKSLLEALTKNKLFGVMLGAFITAVIQSSSATTVMVVGFVNAGIMNLSQAMGVIMGANIGTTVTGWLVSSVEWAKFLSPANLAPIAIIIGVIIMLTGKRRSSKDISSIIVGFGILFVGITTMSSAVAPLQESEAFCSIFVKLGHNPFLGILAGALVTAIIQSSSASVGILQSLAAAGLVPFNAAVYIIMGQNIGTTLLLFPVSDWIIKLARKLQKEEDGVVDESRVLLDERMLETPSIAIQSVVSEVCRMGYIVKGTMDKTRRVLFTQDEETMNEIREEESIADRLCKGITDYLIRISSLAINEKEHQHVASLLQIVSDIERISDYCENISEYAENLANQKKKFSGVGAAEMKEMLEVCSDSFTYAVEAFEENSAEKALKVIEKERSADDLEIRLRADHMQRLANKQCDTEAGIVFLDALVGLERISDHSRNIAEEVLSASNK